MAESKIYLNVPYAQKDAAKALGARWDAANKKWYVPAGKDITLFAQWQTAQVMAPPPSTATKQTKPRALSNKVSASSQNAAKGLITRAVTKDFVPYNGDEPPWD